jgi:hypothetical protein
MNVDDDDPPPENLSEWSRAGFRRSEAKEWRRWRFELTDAESWRAAGVQRSLTAAQWRTAAVTPQTVRDWIAAGIGPGEAVRWHEFGIGLERAAELTREGKLPGSEQMLEVIHGDSYTAGMTDEQRRQYDAIQRFHANVPHQVAAGYHVEEWYDDEAMSWARKGVGAQQAWLWKSLGLRPGEVDGLGDPAEVIAEWWRAAIPYDEVADWIGAGLSAAEAVKQRGEGVTVEQAKALRALRNAEG